MSTFTNLLFHIIYSTKYRKPTIRGTGKTTFTATSAESKRNPAKDWWRGRSRPFVGQAKSDHCYLRRAAKDQVKLFKVDQRTTRSNSKVRMAIWLRRVFGQRISDALRG